jgi:hypothetical protein
MIESSVFINLRDLGQYVKMAVQCWRKGEYFGLAFCGLIPEGDWQQTEET